MGKTTGFKEATFIEGKLVRIAKSKIEFLSKDETGGLAIVTAKLGEGVNIDLDHVGEEVRAVIVDGRVARITRLTPKPREKPRQEPFETSSVPSELGTDLAD
ncbi:hypothetical protein AUG19_01950 [archaeon 13_1_20CM_2_54_9]|nr:MAG: hypothetical protein AUJ07_05005 [Crenarchaeota archaeon 13_1_40CM_3_53_5]OLE76860.1 MAG: hypothetical protein AUG19_01950 [archaeon 13_1_20CM_2_54_9]